MTYKHTLDPSSKKFTCPSCSKKCFVRYINNETGEYLPAESGSYQGTGGLKQLLLVRLIYLPIDM